MRLLVDAAGVNTGGLGTYVASLIRAWGEAQGGRSDDLHVLVSTAFAEAAHQQLKGATLHTFPPGQLSRLHAQYLRLPDLLREIRPDALLSTLPIVPIRRIACPIVIVCYDLRHEIRPSEFSRSQRIARSIEYRRAYKRASRIVVISNRTGGDVIARHPKLAAKVVVAQCGCDHIQSTNWKQHSNDGGALAYAHHRNKRPELAIEAWAVISRTGVSNVPRLVVVGASDSTATKLRRLAADLHVPPDLLSVSGTLGAADYTRLLETSRVLVFPSSFEGFGLPVLEALRLHVPVVITPDTALLEVGGDHVTVAFDSTPESVASAVQKALAIDHPDRRSAGAKWAASFTWRKTASAIRGALVSAISDQRH